MKKILVELRFNSKYQIIYKKTKNPSSPKALIL